jgi:hypothetical protein
MTTVVIVISISFVVTVANEKKARVFVPAVFMAKLILTECQ